MAPAPFVLTLCPRHLRVFVPQVASETPPIPVPSLRKGAGTTGRGPALGTGWGPSYPSPRLPRQQGHVAGRVCHGVLRVQRALRTIESTSTGSSGHPHPSQDSDDLACYAQGCLSHCHRSYRRHTHVLGWLLSSNSGESFSRPKISQVSDPPGNNALQSV